MCPLIVYCKKRQKLFSFPYAQVSVVAHHRALCYYDSSVVHTQLKFCKNKNDLVRFFTLSISLIQIARKFIQPFCKTFFRHFFIIFVIFGHPSKFLLKTRLNKHKLDSGLTSCLLFNMPVQVRTCIQWRSEYRASLVFKWSERGRMPIDPVFGEVFKCDLNSG